MWDLQRNGGSVAATTERILGRGLEVVSGISSLCFAFSPLDFKVGVRVGRGQRKLSPPGGSLDESRPSRHIPLFLTKSRIANVPSSSI